jgi:hypothetical protein
MEKDNWVRESTRSVNEKRKSLRNWRFDSAKRGGLKVHILGFFAEYYNIFFPFLSNCENIPLMLCHPFGWCDPDLKGSCDGFSFDFVGNGPIAHFMLSDPGSQIQ